MCNTCDAYTTHSPASTSTTQIQANSERMIGQDSSDDGVTEEVELALEDQGEEKSTAWKAEEGMVVDGAEDLDRTTAETTGRKHRRSTKRPRNSDLDVAHAARSRKRYRSEEPSGSAELAAYEETARIVGLVTNIFTLVVTLQQTTEGILGSSSALPALKEENIRQQNLLQEKLKHIDELTRVLWAVRDQYYKLKTSSSKGQEKIDQLNENLRMLTKDHDTLMRERNQAQAAANEGTKKSDELQRVLWTVRTQYYNLKSNLDKATADAREAAQRNDQLSRQMTGLARQKEDLEKELKEAKNQIAELQSQPNKNSLLVKDLSKATAECERLRKSERVAVFECAKQKNLYMETQANFNAATTQLAQTQDTVDELRRELQEARDRELKLSAERDRLAHDKSRLDEETKKITEERDRYRESHAQTVAEKGRLEKAVLKTEEERQQLADEKEKFVLDWDRLIMQRDNVLKERDYIRVERDTLQYQNLSLASEKSLVEDALLKASKENEALLASHGALVAERDALITAREALVTERDALLVTKSQLSQDKTMLRIEVGRLLDQEAKQRIEDTITRAKNAELYDELLKENVELRNRMTKMDQPAMKIKAL